MISAAPKFSGLKAALKVCPLRRFLTRKSRETHFRNTRPAR